MTIPPDAGVSTPGRGLGHDTSDPVGGIQRPMSLHPAPAR
ncbi:hypothetical protein FBZ86_106138 [Gluconacetobacter diazotrophicus]|nr:hypothetical protein FBZ86_106138 [Gluconacetobacter diazotrophicus]